MSKLEKAGGLTIERIAESPTLFEQFPYGLAICDGEGLLRQLNHRARRILLPSGPNAMGSRSCCEVICGRLGSVVGTGCMTKLALGSKGELPEVRIDLDGERLQTSAWVTASIFESERPFVLFHLRPGRPGDRRRRTRQGWHGDSPGGERAELQVLTLGRFGVESTSGPINGEWLGQRPGDLLKYLLCERRRPASSDQIAEALWPGAGPDEGRNRLRFHIHGLREKLEPERAPHTSSRFIVSRRGGYLFDTARVWVDADEFEREARAGLADCEHDGAGALPHLRRAVELYRGDFMCEDIYAEWAMKERERLRELACEALRAYVEALLDGGELEPAVAPARRLVDLEPFDDGAQRLLIELSLRRGRRSEAVRRFEQYRSRMQRCLGLEPGFDLSSLQLGEVGPPATRLS